jgi:serine/threonine protein phosphatase 1
MTNFYYVIADIHGRYDLLKKTLDHLYEHNKNGGKIIFLGDYVDRGPDSDKVCLELMNPPKNWEFICLKGNHEDMMLGRSPYDMHAALQIAQHSERDIIETWMENLKLFHI